MRKKPRDEKFVWLVCHLRDEPVAAPLRNGRAHCTVCGEFFPTRLEGIQEEEEAPPESGEVEDLQQAS